MTNTEKKVLQRTLQFVVGIDRPIPDHLRDRQQRINSMRESNEKSPCEYYQAQIVEAETGVSFEEALFTIRSVAE